MLRTRYESADQKMEIGVDEAGRGSFWGPIMAGAVCLPDESNWTSEQRTLFEQIRDSKRIAPKKRLGLYAQLIKIVPLHAIGHVDASEINKHGIQWANKEAFRRAVRGVKEKAAMEGVTAVMHGCRVIIDGVLSMTHEEEDMDEKGAEFAGDEQRMVIEGDDRYLAVAAASILAKVGHDLWIQDYCATHPECDERYDMTKSKGYGTAKHREGIQRYGGHELHRVVYIQYWLPGSTVIRPKRTSKRTKTLDFTECLIQMDGGLNHAGSI